MIWAVIFLMLLIVGMVGFGAYYYVKSQQAAAASQPRAAGASALLRGVLAAYTGGLSGAITSGFQRQQRAAEE